MLFKKHSGPAQPVQSFPPLHALSDKQLAASLLAPCEIAAPPLLDSRRRPQPIPYCFHSISIQLLLLLLLLSSPSLTLALLVLIFLHLFCFNPASSWLLLQ